MDTTCCLGGTIGCDVGPNKCRLDCAKSDARTAEPLKELPGDAPKRPGSEVFEEWMLALVRTSLGERIPVDPDVVSGCATTGLSIKEELWSAYPDR